MDDNESSDSEQGEGGHYGYGGQVTAKQKRMDAIKTKEDKEENHATDLIVLGLPFKLTETDLKNYFEQFGKMKLCEVRYRLIKSILYGCVGNAMVKVKMCERE